MNAFYHLYILDSNRNDIYDSKFKMKIYFMINLMIFIWYIINVGIFPYKLSQTYRLFNLGQNQNGT
jgi:hypothetical protein